MNLWLWKKKEVLLLLFNLMAKNLKKMELL